MSREMKVINGKQAIPEIARKPTNVRVPSSLTKTSNPERSTRNDDAAVTDSLTPATNGCIQWCRTVTTLVRLWMSGDMI